MKKVFPGLALLFVISTFSIAASAKDEVYTLHNNASEAVDVHVKDHECIHHPSRFEITIPAGESKTAAADWVQNDFCKERENDYIRVCVHSQCYAISYGKPHDIYINKKHGSWVIGPDK